MKKTLISLAKLPDSFFCKLYLGLFNEKNSLMIFNFHGFFRNKEEINQNLVDPQTWITVNQFHQFIEYYLEHNYTFVSPDNLLNGLKNDKKYAMITFDDGYYNNIYALPFLKKYKIPALFFISTDHIKQKKCFWWDVLYRENIKSGKSEKDILQEQNHLKSKTNEEIEQYLLDKYGENALKPKSDIDRPFTSSELKDFSKEKYVFLGNHTKNHAILTNYSSKEIKSQILNAQNFIHEITKKTPIAISYPNGNYSDEIIKISKDNGIQIGITVEYRKNKLPIDNKRNSYMTLGRFDLSGCNNIIKQCKLFRSDLLLYACLRNFLIKRQSKTKL